MHPWHTRKIFEQLTGCLMHALMANYAVLLNVSSLHKPQAVSCAKLCSGVKRARNTEAEEPGPVPTDSFCKQSELGPVDWDGGKVRKPREMTSWEDVDTMYQSVSSG